MFLIHIAFFSVKSQVLSVYWNILLIRHSHFPALLSFILPALEIPYPLHTSKCFLLCLHISHYSCSSSPLTTGFFRYFQLSRNLCFRSARPPSRIICFGTTLVFAHRTTLLHRPSLVFPSQQRRIQCALEDLCKKFLPPQARLYLQQHDVAEHVVELLCSLACRTRCLLRRSLPSSSPAITITPSTFDASFCARDL